MKKATKTLKKTEAVDQIRRPIVVSEAIIRPTGLIDPEIVVKPIHKQVDDVLEEVRRRVANNQRVLITTLTKKFAEELDLYFKQINLKSAYIHSDVETLERLDILSDLRRGVYDVLIGINLLREGLDLPEVSLVAIFDADKEGFLRSRTSLIQIIGRAARHSEGRVIMYADKVTASMKEAIEETDRRREIQMEYNKKHGITPKSTSRVIHTVADEVRDELEKNEDFGKAGAILTTLGFEEREVNLDEMMPIESRFARKPSRSVHNSNPAQASPKKKGRQVYANFDEQKSQLVEQIRALDLTADELLVRLDKAIAEQNFEEAAAVRDLLGGN